MEELLQRIEALLERIANALESADVVIEPPSSEDWTDIYNSPRFAPTTDTRWITIQRDLRTKVWTGKYNGAGSPQIRNRIGLGTKLQAGQKVLVYAKPFQADSWRCWELCDPAEEYVRFIDTVVG